MECLFFPSRNHLFLLSPWESFCSFLSYISFFSLLVVESLLCFRQCDYIFLSYSLCENVWVLIRQLFFLIHEVDNGLMFSSFLMLRFFSIVVHIFFFQFVELGTTYAAFPAVRITYHLQGVAGRYTSLQSFPWGLTEVLIKKWMYSVLILKRNIC